MRFRILAALALAAAIGVVANAAPSALRQGSALFMKPTLVAGHYILGSVLFVHDDTKMARGAACTTLYSYKDGKRGEQLVSFHCKPVARPLANEVKVTCTESADLKTMVMTEFQLPGEREGHGVPKD
jgi:hypothetical protein